MTASQILLLDDCYKKIQEMIEASEAMKARFDRLETLSHKPGIILIDEIFERLEALEDHLKPKETKTFACINCKKKMAVSFYTMLCYQCHEDQKT